jgi:hypothetical protein
VATAPLYAYTWEYVAQSTVTGWILIAGYN